MSRARNLLLAQVILAISFASVSSAEDAGIAEEAEAPTVAVERFTAKRFPIHRDLADEPYVLVGTGARRAAGMINIYGAAMYVGREDALSSWRSQAETFAEFRCSEGAEDCEELDFDKLRRSPQARRFLVNGSFPKAVEMSFVRGVTADQMTREYEDAWDVVRLRRDDAGPGLPRFMELLGHPVAAGEQISIRTSPDNEIWVETPRGVTRIEGNRHLVTALWSIWLGNPCLQATLRDGMMSALTNLHGLLTP